MEQLASVISRVFFICSFLLVGLAFWEKLANFWSLTVLRGYPPSRLIAYSAVALLFVIALQLREIKISLGTKRSD